MLLLDAHHLGWLKSPRNSVLNVGKWKDWLRKEREVENAQENFGQRKEILGIVVKRIFGIRGNQLSVSLTHTIHLLGWPVPSQTKSPSLPASSFLTCHTWIIIALVLPAPWGPVRNWTCFVNLKVWLHKRDYYLVVVLLGLVPAQTLFIVVRDKATHETIRELCKMVSNNCRIVWWSLYGGKRSRSIFGSLQGSNPWSGLGSGKWLGWKFGVIEIIVAEQLFQEVIAGDHPRGPSATSVMVESTQT